MMDRFTEYEAVGGQKHAIPKHDVDKAIQRLAAYEDTGLEPDEIPSWIDAEDETPDIGQTVLVYLPDKEEEKIRVGEYLGEGDYRIGRKVYRGYEIGAWMLLSAAPKEEK